MKQTAADKAALAHLEPVEPKFVAQSGNAMSDNERSEWFIKSANAMRLNGATHFRYSYSEDIADGPVSLVEGWIGEPANMGEPYWQLTHAV